MFYENLKESCAKNNTNVTNLLKKLNLPTANTGSWKKGMLPKGETLKLIAKELNVSTDYLLGLTEQQNFTLIKTEENNMQEKRFWDNPLPLILKALRLEQGLTIEQFSEKLIMDNPLISQSQYAEYYEKFETLNYNSIEIEKRNIPEKLLPPMAKAISEYYKNKIDLKKEKVTEIFKENLDKTLYYNIINKEKYPKECDFNPSDELLDLQTKFARDNNIAFNDVPNELAKRIKCLEEISIRSFLSGERKFLDDLCERKIYAAFGHLELSDKNSSAEELTDVPTA